LDRSNRAHLCLRQQQAGQHDADHRRLGRIVAREPPQRLVCVRFGTRKSTTLSVVLSRPLEKKIRDPFFALRPYTHRIDFSLFLSFHSTSFIIHSCFDALVTQHLPQPPL
jgi:hypothetical protein